jgi:hypothetical protein
MSSHAARASGTHHPTRELGLQSLEVSPVNSVEVELDMGGVE